MKGGKVLCYVCSAVITGARSKTTGICSLNCLIKSCSAEKENGCWEQFRTMRYQYHSYRTLECKKLIYELLEGHLGEGMYVKQICGNMKCINPDHLVAIPMEQYRRDVAIESWRQNKFVRKPKMNIEGD